MARRVLPFVAAFSLGFVSAYVAIVILLMPKGVHCVET